MGAIEVCDEKESKENLKDAIGSRILHTARPEKDLRADPSLAPDAKSRWIVQGFLERALSQFRKDAPTASAEALGTLLQYIASMGMSLESGDVRNAYLTGQDLGRAVYVKQPAQGLPGVAAGLLLKARKGLYGLVDAARKFFLHVRGILLNLGF